jgi:nuclear pore complex protein Nup54
VGFKDLLSRSAAQQQAVEENQARLRSLSDLQHRMSRQHSVDLKGRALDVQKRHIELSHKLLHVMRLIDALESRLASSLG